MTEEKDQPPQSETPATALLSTISEQLKDSRDQVRQKVIKARVDTEISKRADILDKALIARSAAQADLKKLAKPDDKLFNEDGSLKHEGFSQSRIKDRERLQQRLAKIDKAITGALDDNEWDRLNEIK